MFTLRNKQELEENGYTVVSGVLSENECEMYIQEYKNWLHQFKDGNWPHSKASLIHRHNTGNLHTTWKIKLKCKKVFTQIWKTDKLLTSVDAIAIGRPPEDGEEVFAEERNHWLHTDQSARRLGLHAYQGAVYLETTDEDDWTFHLLTKSHKYLDEFYQNNQKQAFKSTINEYYHLRDEDYEWFKSKGCRTIRLPVPKGGMVLWDSRLIHANARPKRNRRNPGRWRYTVFVCMTPAIWATKDDIDDRKEAYRTASMTSHWPSQGIRYMNTSLNSDTSTTDLPSIAQTEDARQLWGCIPYDFKDGQSNGILEAPKLNPFYDSVSQRRSKQGNVIGPVILLGVALTGLLAFLTYKFLSTHK